MNANTPPTTPTPVSMALEVLDFWFGDALQSDWPADDRNALWFGGDSALDQQITERFGPLVNAALDGGCQAWEASPETRLALIVLLDQFPRNVFRGQPRAFAGDARAQQLVLQTLALGQDAALPRVGRVFLYMPLMHAEHLDLQDECVSRFSALLEGATPELRDTLAGNLRFAHLHRDIIATYGRFPHRNAALGRVNTPAEEAFLTNGPRFGQ
ncbi:MAG: hypothetical protein A3E51_13955 [Burkholderiales bacterium RIFCSPHIGHO2_12_FULL_67_38]|nr:MAG: hypothetical protein A3I64_16895 [Burkholderiales bacterium RIFCSPLOWO2_02_FULL_67_64]OGB35692.1 MAG: hypothetical protein A3E51_13955 [Burkholderiales bacterium RIFCSPHIGHO2_12_FULL_67_38]OGC01901.1 MAG: hypothetical protein A3G82_21860 [Burkholderiales bacterium RIFCSPLOWO2_12_FULL_67_210]